MAIVKQQTSLLIRAGRVICPASGIDSPGAVLVRDGRIADVELETDDVERSPDAARNAVVDTDVKRVFNFPDGILLPGLIDLHAHPANADSVFGVPPDEAMLLRGTTTAMSQGDAGAANIDRYLQRTIQSSLTRVFLAINLSRIGESTAGGCFEDPDDADVDACVATAERHRDVVKAIAVNVSHHACGQTDPREILRRGLTASEATGLPLLYGMRRPEDWPLAEQLGRLRAGDIVTYCFRREPHCIVEDGRVLPCVHEARRRGVLFDTGHGTASFAFEVAEAAIRDGFLPDTISTDLQKKHFGVTPPHDLPLVMAKLRAAGMSESDIFAAVTAAPARILRIRQETGAIALGRPADLTVLSAERSRPLEDAHGIQRSHSIREPLLTVRGKAVAAQDALLQ